MFAEFRSEYENCAREVGNSFFVKVRGVQLPLLWLLSLENGKFMCRQRLLSVLILLCFVFRPRL